MRDRLKKTKVSMRNTSEQGICDLISEFTDKCESCKCNECSIVRHRCTFTKEQCMARYLYENMADKEVPNKIIVEF